MNSVHRAFLVLISWAALVPASRAQFVDHFDGTKIDGWFTMTGDGVAGIEFVPHAGFARMQIDGTRDPHNVWWTLIKRDVAAALDLSKLKDPAYELRVEARIRISHAPRRVNFMVNTQRTTDFHEHLREYDIAKPGEWQTISMTTRNLDAVPGDTLFVQLAATDWGEGKFHVDVDTYRADIVRLDEAGPDQGEPLIYHPEVPDLKTFAHRATVAHDSLIDAEFPDVNFNDWQVEERAGPARVLSIGARRWAVLRWDFSAWRGRKAQGAGVLELTTSSLAKGGDYNAHFGPDLGIEFGKVRVFEILGGDPAWEQAEVAYRSLLQGGEPAEVFNQQTTIDLDLAAKPGGKTYFTLPRPVMQRLLDGTTRGLLLRPLGAVAASVYASEQGGGMEPMLHFTTAP